MTKCNDKLYILGGYAPQQHYPADVWSLPVEAIIKPQANRRSVQPQNLHIAAAEQSTRYDCAEPGCITESSDLAELLQS